MVTLKYFFNLVSDGEVIPDEEGINVSYLDDALMQAVQAVEELRHEDLVSAGEWQGWWLEVTDDAGQIVLSVSLDHANSEQRPLESEKRLRADNRAFS
jgi:hypothetical protein